jgi:hypothetical protein
MNLAALRTVMIAATLVAPLGTAALAQAVAPMKLGTTLPTASSLVKVSACNPHAPEYVGFSPGYYPYAPYFWTDPYGFRYRQFPPTPTSATLSIDYMNVSAQVMTTIDFGLVARGRLVAEVRDVGKFSPHAEIKHQFGLSNNVFPLRTDLSRCIPLHIIYAGGATWTNPHLPKLRHEIYNK